MGSRRPPPPSPARSWSIRPISRRVGLAPPFGASILFPQCRGCSSREALSRDRVLPGRPEHPVAAGQALQLELAALVEGEAVLRGGLGRLSQGLRDEDLAAA